MMRSVGVLVAWLVVATPLLRAEIQTKVIEYEYDGTKLKGFVAWDDAIQGKRPGVLLVHEWWGLNEHARDRAKMVAKLGYVAFACDMYGNGEVTEHPKKASEMASTVRSNLKLWLGRARAGLDQLKNFELTDRTRLGAIGFCFGGSTVLQLAYSGADLDVVVTFHAALPVPNETQAKAIKATLLICHGAEDGFIPEKTIQEFRAALDKAKVKYEFKSYPGAVHSFTVPGIEKVGVKGLAYNEKVDKESFQAMSELFKKAFRQADK